MPLPGSITMVSVTEDYRRADGSAPTGTVTFTPTARSTVAGTAIVVESVTATLAEGQLSVSLAYQDDPQLSPVGWAYTVVERIGGETRTRTVKLPSAGPVALHTLAPVDVVATTETRVLTVEGIAPDSAGNIDLPPAAGADPAGTAAGLLDDHVVAVDPHSQYLTAAEANEEYAAVEHVHPESDITGLAGSLAAKENVGVAAGLVSTHAGESNPHPGYLTQAEADALYATLAAVAAKQNRLVSRTARLVGGNINLNVAAGGAVWEVLPGSPTLTIPAAVGDTIGFSAVIGRQSNGNLLMDIGVVTASVIQRWFGNGAIAAAPTAAYEGDVGLYLTNIPVFTGERRFVVVEGDLTAGSVEIKILRKVLGAGSALALMDTTNPGYWQATNYGVAL